MAVNTKIFEIPSKHIDY